MPKKEIGGWISASPLNNYSSLHEFSLTRWLGWERLFQKQRLWIQFDFNLNSPFDQHPNADLTFHACDANTPADPKRCFSIDTATRWRLDITPYQTFDDFLQSVIRWHRCNYTKSKKTFAAHGCTIKLYEGDWSDQVDTIYKLYCNVAKHHGNNLYDLSYFQTIAKQSNYKVLSAWFQGNMIAMLILEEEPGILHSTCGGMDYKHSSDSFAYSWLHFELIRLAIEAKKYQYIDVGLTADNSKQAIGFTPIPIRMDLYAKNKFLHMLLKAISPLVSTSITSDAQLQVRLRWQSAKGSKEEHSPKAPLKSAKKQ